MKNILIFLLCSFITSQIIAQPFEKKQITNFNYDSRGASFPIYPEFGSSFFVQPPMFFEARDGSYSNIMMINYNRDSDIFSSPIQITENNYLNVNPIAEGSGFYPYNKINLIWQTNENGNWDIAIRTLTDSTISEKKILSSSPEDETTPQFVLKTPWQSSDYEIEIVYEKSNSIYLYQQKDSIINNKLIFSGNDSVHYFQPTGAYSAPWAPSGRLYIAAVYQVADSISKIVYRYKSIIDSVWSDIYTAFDSGYSQIPKFIQYSEFPLLSLEMKIDGINRILFFQNLDDLGKNQFAQPVIDDSNVSTSDLKSILYRYITYKDRMEVLGNNRYFPSISPYTFKVLKNDSTYAVYLSNYSSERFLFLTAVNDTRIDVGNLGMINSSYISYTIWEDSSNDHINLFGAKRLDPIGDINDKIIANNYILFQNYPNPFNPKTVIKYGLLSRDYITLKVYDMLGKEVSTLVNEEKPAGEYSIVFDGSNLASGMYVYRLSVGNNHLSRKMILLK